MINAHKIYGDHISYNQMKYLRRSETKTHLEIWLLRQPGIMFYFE